VSATALEPLPQDLDLALAQLGGELRGRGMLVESSPGQLLVSNPPGPGVCPHAVVVAAWRTRRGAARAVGRTPAGHVIEHARTVRTGAELSALAARVAAWLR
jgi:hypothetical protein